jgi:hypothetical protein
MVFWEFGLRVPRVGGRTPIRQRLGRCPKGVLPFSHTRENDRHPITRQNKRTSNEGFLCFMGKKCPFFTVTP